MREGERESLCDREGLKAGLVNVKSGNMKLKSKIKIPVSIILFIAYLILKYALNEVNTSLNKKACGFLSKLY